jgi:biotin transport system permease protein
VVTAALGMYLPGNSPVHRAPAGLKLALLAALMTTLMLWRTPAGLALVAATLAAAFAASGLGPRDLGRQLRPALPIVVIVAAGQVWLAGPRTAFLVAAALLLAVATAALVTLTTRTVDLLDAFVGALRPLRVMGIDPERVALVMALAVRSVPVLAQLAMQVLEARRARGAERSVRAFAVPFVIRTLRHADRLGEALSARGIDD